MKFDIYFEDGEGFDVVSGGDVRFFVQIDEGIVLVDGVFGVIRYFLVNEIFFVFVVFEYFEEFFFGYFKMFKGLFFFDDIG